MLVTALNYNELFQKFQAKQGGAGWLEGDSYRIFKSLIATLPYVEAAPIQ